MNEHLNLLNSEFQTRELQREAEEWRLGHPAKASGMPKAPQISTTLVIRLARREDDEALRRLAQVDCHPPPEHSRLLVAEVDGELLAALPLAGGDPIADPFRPTAQLVQMLKLRAAQLRDTAAPRRGLWARISRGFRSNSRRPAIAPATPGNARMLITRD